MHWPRGRVLGGSSELNFMVYMRGNPRDYDNWASLSGDDQWRYENVLPYFKKSENYKGNWPNRKKKLKLLIIFSGIGQPFR